VFVAADFWRVVGGIGHFSTHFGHASIILKLFIILPAILSLKGPDRAIHPLQLDNAGGIKLGIFLAPGTGIKLNEQKSTREFLGQF
jgi:hypothetical protein